MSYFTFDGKKVYYTEIGTGTPLVLLHGNTASSKLFAESVDSYKNDCKVILIDFLGHGKSDRLDEFPSDLWFYEAQQIIAFLTEKQYGKANLIGCSGGALVAINVALEAPALVGKVIADSFEGERSLAVITDHMEEDREQSKQDEQAKIFYETMHGQDWEQVVDKDTRAVCKHGKESRAFFHREIGTLEAEILFTGSKADEFACAINPNFFQEVYGALLLKVPSGNMHLFETGGHPAMLTNQAAFYQLSKDFFGKEV